MKKIILLSAIAAFLTLPAAPGLAYVPEPVTLTDGNATAYFDGYIHSSGAALAGWWKDWKVDGQDNLYQARMCYRDNATATDNRQRTWVVKTPVIGSTAMDRNGDGNNDTLSIQRMNDSLFINELFTLDGLDEGSGRSTMNWQATFVNWSAETLNLSFFQFLDFDLGNISDNELSQHSAGDPFYTQWDDSSMVAILLTPDAGHWYSGSPGCPYSFQMRFGSMDLNDIAANNGAGDVGWLFQWDVSLAPGGSFNAGSHYEAAPVPVPGAIWLLGGGLGALLAGRRRHDRKV